MDTASFTFTSVIEIIEKAKGIVNNVSLVDRWSGRRLIDPVPSSEDISEHSVAEGRLISPEIRPRKLRPIGTRIDAVRLRRLGRRHGGDPADVRAGQLRPRRPRFLALRRRLRRRGGDVATRRKMGLRRRKLRPRRSDWIVSSAGNLSAR